ncbi:hypothetical protein [Ruegeria arenilitoris]|uniref:hypothetical protein n=1 Tax=Ruegeria arenilitoris TaxID=1173585 RepID=UPI001C9453CF|nr:hypothetical protein [Ruegeria arenilitoris]MBY6083712.1 hypothetical protein [Ruegeria arenilitoris]
MISKGTSTASRVANPIFWGVVATVGILAFGFWTAHLAVCDTTLLGSENCEESKWRYFLKAAPNEVGDTLAGFAGALAFVWLIATVWLQGQELAAQRQELREQRLATQEMAQAQNEQVQMLKLQGDIFRQEQKQRLEDRNDALLQRKLENLKAYLIRRFKEEHFVGWLFDMQGLFKFYDEPDRMPWQQREKAEKFLDAFPEPDLFFPALPERAKKVRKEYGPPVDAKRPENVVFESLGELIRSFDEINELSALVSPPAKVRIETLQISEIKGELQSFDKLFNSLPESDVEG